MASKARAAFTENSAYVKHLMGIHIDLTTPDNRDQNEVLIRSAIVLICAIWEAYCEDIATEAIEHVLKHGSADNVSEEIKELVGNELKKEDYKAIWSMAGKGWKDVIRTRLKRIQEGHNWDLNNPKSYKIKLLFREALGIHDITDEWKWKGMTKNKACSKLDEYVTLRGEIAHRGRALEECTREQVTEFLQLVKKLAGRTGMVVNRTVKEMTSKPLWD